MNQPTFSERDWNTRKGGDLFYYSEGKFEEHWPGPYAHFGLGAETEGMATYKMGAYMSHAPDYIAALNDESVPVLVEVQGTGKGGAKSDGTLVHKFKAKKLDALGKWNSNSEVTFWLWNDADESWIWTSYVSIRGMIATGKATQGLFDGKRPYWALPVEIVEELADTARLMDRYG
jgi:hypothetical protein